MNQGFVYILTNEAMPGLVKIGRTSRDVDLRASELWKTGVPSKFEVFWSCKTPDCLQLENYAHAALRDYRVNMAREFFKIDVFKAQEVVRLWASIQANEWCLENFSEFSIVHNSEIMAVSGIDRLAEETGRPKAVISSAIARIKSVELQPAIERERLALKSDQIEIFRQIGIPADEWEGLLDE